MQNPLYDDILVDLFAFYQLIFLKIITSYC
jgi:hypothetical protein